MKKTLCQVGLGFFITLLAASALAQNSTQDLASYLPLREQVKALDLETLKTIVANPQEKPTKKGIANYYVFIKTPVPDGDVAAGKKTLEALETAADVYMDPLSYVKLALIHARDNPAFGVKQDRTKTLRYLSSAWEIGDLSDRATGDNALLTLIINNSLGLGDGLFADGANGVFPLKQSLDTIRPGVLAARARFKKLYGLSVKDESPESTNVERHYAR